MPMDLREVFRGLTAGGPLIIIAEVYKGANTAIAKMAERHASRTGMTLLDVDKDREQLITAGYSEVQVTEERDKG